MRAPWRLGAFAVLIGACCTAELSGDTRWYDVTALLLAAGLAFAGRTWLARGSGKFALGLAGGAAVFTVALGIDPLAVIGGAARMSDVVILMLSIAMVRPIFAEWLQPFADLGASTLTLRNTGGTDHLSFDAVGLPGFQFIQDPLDYDTRVHHSHLDVYDHAVPADLMQAAAIVATFVWQAANRPEMLPRKPLPPPLPPKKEGGASAAGP